VRQWPVDWQARLGAIAGNTAFTRADLDSLTVADVGFYLGCINAHLEQIRPKRR